MAVSAGARSLSFVPFLGWAVMVIEGSGLRGPLMMTGHALITDVVHEGGSVRALEVELFSVGNKMERYSAEKAGVPTFGF